MFKNQGVTILIRIQNLMKFEDLTYLTIYLLFSDPTLYLSYRGELE